MSKQKDALDSAAIRDLLSSRGWQMIEEAIKDEIEGLSSMVDSPEWFNNPGFLKMLIQRDEKRKLLLWPKEFLQKMEKAEDIQDSQIYD